MDCGQVNKHRILYGTWYLRCCNSACRQRWAIGLIFRRMAHGARRMIPPDMTLPTVPQGERLQPGAMIHELGEPIGIDDDDGSGPDDDTK